MVDNRTGDQRRADHRAAIADVAKAALAHCDRSALALWALRLDVSTQHLDDVLAGRKALHMDVLMEAPHPVLLAVLTHAGGDARQGVRRGDRGAARHPRAGPHGTARGRRRDSEGAVMRLLAQDFLVSRSAVDLRKEHGVKLRWSSKRPGVFTLNYDQLEVVDTDPLSQECRGLILRAHGGRVADDQPVGETSIVALPFARFFNFGTGPCAQVNFDHARFYEKLDGTLCIVHHDAGEWHVATRSVPDADVPIDGGDPSATFRTLYERCLPDGVALGDGLDPAYTYLFELTAPENQVVVRYDERCVTLLGARCVETGHEIDPATVGPHYRVCPWHAITMAEMLDWIAERDPSKHEGVVVCDTHFRRCKVKSPGYVALAHTRDSVGKSPRAMMELILLGKDDDARPLLPEYLYPRIDAMKAGLAAECARLDASYAYLLPENRDRKAFALRIQASAYPSDMGAHMARLSGKCSDARSWIAAAKRDGTWPASFLDMLVERAGVQAEPVAEAA